MLNFVNYGGIERGTGVWGGLRDLGEAKGECYQEAGEEDPVLDVDFGPYPPAETMAAGWGLGDRVRVGEEGCCLVVGRHGW